MSLDVMIGNTLEGMIALDELETPLEAPKAEFLDWEDTVTLEDGYDRGMGFRVIRWINGYVEPEQRNQYKTFCPGASAEVYIRTKLNDDSYGTFRAIMIWPRESPRTMGLKTDFVIEFRVLEEIEEAS